MTKQLFIKLTISVMNKIKRMRFKIYSCGTLILIGMMETSLLSHHECRKDQVYTLKYYDRHSEMHEINCRTSRSDIRPYRKT